MARRILAMVLFGSLALHLSGGARAAAPPAPAAPAGDTFAPVDPAEPPLALEDIFLTRDRWPDVSSPAAFARSVARIEGARDAGEEAEALFLWMQRCVYNGPPAYEGRTARRYSLHGGRILRVHGYSTCDGIGTTMAQIWRALGRDAHKTYMPSRGHTIAELEYRDRDGAVRWHAFDAHGGWYARMPDGRVASAEDLARRPDLVPLRGTWAGYKTPGCEHCDMMHAPKWNAGLALHPGESVELLWDGGGRCYFRPETLKSDLRRAFFKEGSSFRRGVGAARFDFEFDPKRCKLEEVCLASNARVGKDGVVNATGDDPAVLEFAFPSPYIYTTGSLEAAVNCKDEGDAVRLFVRPGRSGRWTQVAEHAGAGEAVLKADLGEKAGAGSIRGRYGFYLKVELRSAKPGSAQLTKLRVERWGQLNARLLPPVETGWNRFHLRAGRAAPGWTARVTLAWLGKVGEEFEARTPRTLPHIFDVFGARRLRKEPAIVMRRIRIECVRAPEKKVVIARGVGGGGKNESAAAERLIPLARAGGADALEKLLAALSDEDPETRYWAAHALGELGKRAAVEPLGKTLLTDRSDRVRLGAANALGLLKSPEGVPVLVEALEAKAYEGVQGKKEEILPFGWLLPVRWVVARALAEIGDPRAVKPLVAHLEKSKNHDYTVVLAEALIKLKAAEAVPALARKLKARPHGCGGRACAEALGALATPGAAGEDVVAALLATLKGRSVDARRAAVIALGRLRVEAAAAPLRDLVNSTDDPYVKIPAERALEAIEGAAK